MNISRDNSVNNKLVNTALVVFIIQMILSIIMGGIMIWNLRVFLEAVA